MTITCSNAVYTELSTMTSLEKGPTLCDSKTCEKFKLQPIISNNVSMDEEL